MFLKKILRVGGAARIISTVKYGKLSLITVFLQLHIIVVKKKENGKEK